MAMSGSGSADGGPKRLGFLIAERRPTSSVSLEFHGPTTMYVFNNPGGYTVNVSAGSSQQASGQASPNAGSSPRANGHLMSVDNRGSQTSPVPHDGAKSSVNLFNRSF